MTKFALLGLLVIGVTYSAIAVGIAPAEEQARKEVKRPTPIHRDVARRDTIYTQFARVKQMNVVHLDDHSWAFAKRLTKRERLHGYELIAQHDRYVLAHDAERFPKVYLHHHNELRHALAHIRKIKRSLIPPLQWQWVGATAFGPMYDAGMGTTGYCGSLASHPWSYAELVNGGGLGGLPCGYRFVVKNPATGKTAVLERMDIGLGQPGRCMPGPACTAVMDLWQTANEYLGFNGYGSLLVAPAPKGWKVGPR